MARDIAGKRAKEKEVSALMIELYCRKQHGTARGGLCPECAALREYVFQRVDHCPFMESKSFCSNCHVHCYRSDMRERIRAVMRFSGPRMLFYHPILAIRHVIASRREKKQS